MEKFLSIPVLDANGTNSQRQLVSITGLRNIGQTSTTSVVLHYLGNKIVTLTYPVATASPILELSVSTAIQEALSKGWTNVVELHSPYGSIESMGIFTNPLSAIAISTQV